MIDGETIRHLSGKDNEIARCGGAGEVRRMFGESNCRECQDYYRMEERELYPDGRTVFAPRPIFDFDERRPGFGQHS